MSELKTRKPSVDTANKVKNVVSLQISSENCNECFRNAQVYAFRFIQSAAFDVIVIPEHGPASTAPPATTGAAGRSQRDTTFHGPLRTSKDRSHREMEVAAPQRCRLPRITVFPTVQIETAKEKTLAGTYTQMGVTQELRTPIIIM